MYWLSNGETCQKLRYLLRNAFKICTCRSKFGNENKMIGVYIKQNSVIYFVPVMMDFFHIPLTVFFMSIHLQGLEGLLYLLDLNLAVNQITEIGEQSSRHVCMQT